MILRATRINRSTRASPEWLVTKSDGLYWDATLGLADTRGILNKLPSAPPARLDMDPETLAEARRRLRAHAWRARGASQLRSVRRRLKPERFFSLSRRLFRFGVSSLHFDKPERGLASRGRDLSNAPGAG